MWFHRSAPNHLLRSLDYSWASARLAAKHTGLTSRVQYSLKKSLGDGGRKRKLISCLILIKISRFPQQWVIVNEIIFLGYALWFWGRKPAGKSWKEGQEWPSGAQWVHALPYDRINYNYSICDWHFSNLCLKITVNEETMNSSKKKT